MSEIERLSLSSRAWLDKRRRSGDWFAIAPDDEIPSDIPPSEKTLLNMFQLAFTPEIERRFQAGSIDDNFTLHAAQLLLKIDEPKIVRLNGEVKGFSQVKTDRILKSGEKVCAPDINEIEAFDLPEEEIDCGYFTIIWTEKNWIGYFDFRTGRGKALDFLELAQEFLSAA